MGTPFFKTDNSFALHRAVIKGDLSQVKALIQNAINQDCEERATRIIKEEAKAAAQRGEHFPPEHLEFKLKEMVKTLISDPQEDFIKKFINKKSTAGNLPLHEGMRAVAALQNMPVRLPSKNIEKIIAIMEFLLDSGADVNLKNGFNQLAIQVYLTSLAPRTLFILPEDATTLQNLKKEANQIALPPLAEIVASFVGPSLETRVAEFIMRVCAKSNQQITQKQVHELKTKGYIYLATQLEAFSVTESEVPKPSPVSRKA